MKRIITFLLAAVILLACIPAVHASGGYDKSNLLYDEAFQFLELLNQKRASMGLPAFTMDRELLDGSSIRAYEQSITFGHTRPDGSKFSTVCSNAHAECVHYYYPSSKSTPASALEAFLNSPPHRAILLDKQYHAVGVGVYEVNGRKNWAVLLSQNSAAEPLAATQAQTRKTVGGFSDVYEDDYFAKPVLWAVKNQVTNGTSPSTFSPRETCTRGQIVTFLWRAAGCPAPKSTANPFRDVHSGSYYYNAVLWAVEKGITTGTSNTTFSPKNTCTRAEAATFIWRALGSRIDMETIHPFNDVPHGSYYETAVLWLTDFGIVSGTGNGNFSPRKTCTRAEVVTMLYRVDTNNLTYK